MSRSEGGQPVKEGTVPKVDESARLLQTGAVMHLQTSGALYLMSELLPGWLLLPQQHNTRESGLRSKPSVIIIMKLDDGNSLLWELNGKIQTVNLKEIQISTNL